MQDQLRKSLLSKKSSTFEKLYQDCMVRIQRIKQKNDFLQKQVGTELEQDLLDQIKQQKKFLIREISQMKNIMNDMDKRFKDPQSRNKLKTLKNQAQKQVQRNKVISSDLVSRSFLSRSKGSQNDDENIENYMQGVDAHYYHEGNGINGRNTKNNSSTKNRQQSMLTDQQQQKIEIDYEIQRKILQQKKEILNEVEESTERVNEMMNQMAVMVDQQGDNINIVSDQLMKANRNVHAANQNIQDAQKLQKKSKKKYIIIAAIIIFALAITLVLVFLLKK